jgi:predicted Zn-dependent protease
LISLSIRNAWACCRPRDGPTVRRFDPDLAQALADGIGSQPFHLRQATEYQYDFHVLQDDQTINAFALPGGQIFITRGLLDNLSTEGEVAGVLGHEIAHVVARHSAEQIAKQQLTQGLTGAVVLATYDPDNPASMQLPRSLC